MDHFLLGLILWKPENIGNLHRLEWFGCEVNYSLEGLFPVKIFNITTIKFLSAHNNQFSGKLPSSMGQILSKLETLAIGSNNFSGVIPSSISNCSNLIFLELDDNKFIGEIPNSLGNLRSLTWLNLGMNRLGGVVAKELSFITSLTHCRNLRVLYIDLNRLNGFLPRSIGNFSTSLEGMLAIKCQIVGNIPSEVGNLSSLIELDLSGNLLTGSIPRTIKGLQMMQELAFYANQIVGSIPQEICSLVHLSWLDLGMNRISGVIPSCMGNISFLQFLHAEKNILVGSIPLSLWNIENLLDLSLSFNFLNGSLPDVIANSKVIYSIKLSHNRFSGNIPSTFGYLLSLRYLFLQHNNLEGSIPETLPKMLSLEMLDLSNNHLYGEIPKSLEALRSLTRFNVSFNKLYGEIPERGSFATFNGSSFISNEALCGNSRFQVPKCDSTSSDRTRGKRSIFLLLILLGVAILVSSLGISILIVKCKRQKMVEVRIGPPTLEIPRISYCELRQATEGFNTESILGTGSVGVVYKEVLRNGMVGAIKFFDLQAVCAVKSFEAECDMLRNVCHRNIVKVISVCSNDDFKALILEYMANGSLKRWLHSENFFLNILQRLKIMLDVAHALEYLHRGYFLKTVHCDLKPSNILLNEDMTAKISDFDIAEFMNDEESMAYTSTLATLGYIAPEYGSEGSVTPAADVYSFGILLMETFTRRKPTDEMFAENLSLRKWVLSSWPNQLSQVIDVGLLGLDDHLLCWL